ncbi:SUF system FeS assembly protein, NifU family [Aedoeadaptatus nemausensis]|uniref:SUF system FeS assembly protein, NifU family n=1 Tax=Aedoeadaptatus nemausensis TaxID=2582829 RepID=A0A6V6Y2T4_9FIRM|nr:SUF system NifU family Fe-S cluster assembly protein [Peptoniphilus nemausensis]CAC9928657.1 SUF system FeS assembly protein, NifU family [Peptoniphilus nemausensis]
MALDDIYTTLIMEESRSEHNKGDLDDPDYKELGHNPSCGDEITLQIKMDDDTLKDLSYTGVGCAISQASTSIMIDTVRGKTREEAIHLADTFINMIKGVAITEEEEDELEDAMAFEGVSKLPARVKCAVLPWYTLKNILEA